MRKEQVKQALIKAVEISEESGRFDEWVGEGLCIVARLLDIKGTKKDKHAWLFEVRHDYDA
jgi:hypothetical protein